MLISPRVDSESIIKDSFAIKHLDKEIYTDSIPHRLNFHKIYLLHRGQGEIQVDDVLYQLGAAQLILIAKGQVEALSAGTNLYGFEILFGDCFWERTPSSASNCKAVLFNDAAANQQLKIDCNDLNELMQLFQVLLTENNKPEYANKVDALAAYLKIIMIKIGNVNASLHRGFDDQEKQIYRRFLELVSDQYHTHHDVAAFADQLFVTPRKLTEICQRSSGKGAKEVINGQLLAEAKRSLMFSAKSVKEIAYLLSFSSPEQFSHFFKKTTGLSPVDYRDAYVINHM
ncbi:AraC family transcriptional regulator [Mucilaginibacter phyllosphaerae]